MDDTEGELRLRDELDGFLSYGRELRDLWHWISILLDQPKNEVYLHRWLGEISLEDGGLYCPATTPHCPVAPAYPGIAKTPLERALIIAIHQCEHIYLSLGKETAVDNVDRLAGLLPHCQEYCSRIRLAVGKAKRGWNDGGGGFDWRMGVAQKAAEFRRCWQDVVDQLLDLMHIVDVELHSTSGTATTQPPAARGNSPTHTPATNKSSTTATPDRETLLATMPDAWRQVYLANQYAESKAGKTLTATAAYAWLREHGFDGYELPLPDTFADYRTKAFNHLGEQRKRRRIVDTSRSVVRRSALDTTGDADD